MLNKKDIVDLERCIQLAFPNTTKEMRKEMLDVLVNYPGAETGFVTYVGEHIARVGVKTKKGNTEQRKLYYANEYYVDFEDKSLDSIDL